VPPCRPSFSDILTPNESDEPNKFDRHFWSNVSVLNKPCASCKRKSVSTSLFGTTRPSTMPTLDIMSKGMINNNNNESPVPGSPKISGSRSGLQCLWCSRGYHRRCWEEIFNQDDKNKCDYGVLR